MSGIASSDSAVEAAYPYAGRAWAVIAILFLASLVSVLDRGILGLVVDPVRRDLGIGDLQISLLQGLSFGIFYAAVGLPIGLAADRTHRKWMITIGIAVWSLATMVGAFATSFGAMFAARLFVGLGEATLAPCAVSMIGDLFGPANRGRPLGVFIMGQALAGGLSIMITGLILAAAPRGTFDFIPGAAGLAPWRVTFLIAGLSGFVVVAMMLLVREPHRRGVVLAGRNGSGLALTARYLAANWRVFAPFYLGFAMAAMVAYGFLAWGAAMLMRQYGVSVAWVGSTMGLAGMIAGTIGAFTAGNLIDVLAQRGSPTAKLSLLSVLPLFALPATFATFAPTPFTAALLIANVVLVYPMIGTSMLAAIQQLVPNDMRGASVGLFGVTNTLLGSALGPLLIALVTEHLLADPKAVGRGMLIVGIPALIASVCCFRVALRALRRALASDGALRTVMLSSATSAR